MKVQWQVSIIPDHCFPVILRNSFTTFIHGCKHELSLRASFSGEGCELIECKLKFFRLKSCESYIKIALR